MKQLTIFCLTLWVAKESFAIPVVENKNYEDEYAHVIYNKAVEEFLKTVPKSVAEEAKMTVPQLIKKKGYPVESHTVVTKDGYILTLHRIPHKKGGSSGTKPVVFLQHGVLCSSADWVLTGPEKALAYLLADKGYDVWMGNARGTRYSRSHSSLTPKDSKFWDFSWHEIGTNDLPAMIDYVLAKTKAKNLHYVGHSQGTTSFYVMASEKPEYNSKIRSHFSLAPVAYMKDMYSPLLRIIAKADGGLESILKLIGVYEFLPHSSFVAKVGDILCGGNSITQTLCTNSLFAIAGFSPQQMNGTILPVLTGHTPAGASTKQLLHYAQEINSGHFRQYDYGKDENLKKYGKETPPDYNTGKITTPIYLIYSKNDWLSAVNDVERLRKQLPNVKQMIEVKDQKFNHLDYLYGIGSRDLVYQNLVQLMAKH